MTGTRSMTMTPSNALQTERAVTKSSLKIKVVSSKDDSELRVPPSFQPPDLPLPSPSFSQVDLFNKLCSTPIQSPVASPFRTAPTKLIDTLVTEETAYLDELLVLQRIIRENLIGNELSSLADPVERLVDLSSELKSKLAQKTSYFSEPQKDCLLHFSKVASAAYEPYLLSFRLGVSAGISQSPERIRLLALLQTLDKAGEADRDLDWLMRRPLSRLRAYSNLYKKLLHSSDDATDMFLAYETFHSLLIQARETLDHAREKESLGPATNFELGRTAQRSVSGGSTSTQSSSNSKISSTDELTGLQGSISTATCRDIFSLSPTTCTLDLIARADEPRRTIVNRENFQLMLHNEAPETLIDCLVEVILLTDQMLVVKPTFSGPQLMFPPLQRGVFHVSYIPSEPRILELDIVGRQTMRLTAATKEARQHWYELLLACEDFKLDAMPAVPQTLAQHIGQKSYQPWMPLAPARLPPTPPHSNLTPSFGMTAPLRVIRENSQLSIGGYSDGSGRTPDAKDQAPFHFDLSEDDATPRVAQSVDPFDQHISSRALGASAVLDREVAEGLDKVKGPAVQPGLQADDGHLSFPEPPNRDIPAGSVLMTKSQTVDLFSASSYTDQFLRAPTLDFRSKTLQPPGTPKVDCSEHDKAIKRTLHGESPAADQDLEFDVSSLDLPTLPAFDFGDGVRRPSSVALNFSPNTMTHFGIPMRKVPAPKPMVIPDVAPLKISPQKPRSSDSLAHRRLGNEMSLQEKPAPYVHITPSIGREEVFSTMAECFSWVHGTWTPILMDNVDAAGRMKTVRSSQITIYFAHGGNGSLEIYDKKDGRVINTFVVLSGTSIIRDDSCDISVGFDVGLDKVYYMFRAENPDKANAMQHSLNQAKFAAPHTGFVTPVLPVTPLWPETDSSATLVESLKIKLYIFDNGKWVNKGSARLTVRLVARTKSRRITLTGKTKKNERIMLVDHVAAPGDCDAISKTSISVKTKVETYMLQFKGGEKERAKVLGFLVD